MPFYFVQIRRLTVEIIAAARFFRRVLAMLIGLPDYLEHHTGPVNRALLVMAPKKGKAKINRAQLPGQTTISFSSGSLRLAPPKQAVVEVETEGLTADEPAAGVGAPSGVPAGQTATARKRAADQAVLATYEARRPTSRIHRAVSGSATAAFINSFCLYANHSLVSDRLCLILMRELWHVTCTSCCLCRDLNTHKATTKAKDLNVTLS